MGTMTNREDPDEMPHKTAFHRDLHCLLGQIRYSGKEIQFWGEIITCDPTLYQGSHRLEKYFNIQDCLEKSLKIKFALKST